MIVAEGASRLRAISLCVALRSSAVDVGGHLFTAEGAEERRDTQRR